MMPTLKTNLGFQILLSLSQFLFPLISYPYLSRVIGAEGLGKITYVEYVVNIIITLVSFGIPVYGIREIAKAKSDEAQKGKIFGQLVSLHCISSIIGVTCFLFYLQIDKQNSEGILTFLGCTTILLSAFNAEWYMQGIEEFKFIAIRNVVLRLLGLATTFLFVRTPNDSTAYFVIITAVQFLITMTNLWRIGFGKIAFTQVGKIKKHLRSLMHFYFISGLISVYIYLDVVILGWYADSTNIGYYSTAIKIIKLSLFIILSFNAVVLPRVSSLTATFDYFQVKQLVQRALQFVVCTSIPICILLFSFADEIIQLVAGSKFQGSVPLIQILSLLPFLIGLSNVFGYQVLAAMNNEKKLVFSVSIACLLSLILNTVLANFFLERGSAVATLLTELSVTCITGYYAICSLKFVFPIKILLQTIIASVSFALLSLLFRPFSFHPLMVLSLSISIGSCVYALLQIFVFKNALFLQVWRGVKQKLLPVKPFTT